MFIRGSFFLSASKPNYITISKLIPIGTTNRHGLMLSFSKTPKKAIPGYFILITPLTLQNYQIGSVNSGITFVALLNSFTHTLWLKRATNFLNRISEASRDKRNFPQCISFVPNSLYLGYAHGTLTTTTKILM
jgi:hypothetical protein